MWILGTTDHFLANSAGFHHSSISRLQGYLRYFWSYHLKYTWDHQGGQFIQLSGLDRDVAVHALLERYHGYTETQQDARYASEAFPWLHGFSAGCQTCHWSVTMVTRGRSKPLVMSEKGYHSYVETQQAASYIRGRVIMVTRIRRRLPGMTMNRGRNYNSRRSNPEGHEESQQAGWRTMATHPQLWPFIEMPRRRKTRRCSVCCRFYLATILTWALLEFSVALIRIVNLIPFQWTKGYCRCEILTWNW